MQSSRHHSVSRSKTQAKALPNASGGLYTPEQQRRRDESVWTLVQGILAPLQFLVFLVSLGLVLHYLQTSQGHDLAAWSVLLKTTLLLTIMVTGALWEHDVFGRYLFAPAFFWEDVVSFGVIALHACYVVMFALSIGSATQQMLIALLAYSAYLVNAAQFVWKFRLARISRQVDGQTKVQSKVQARDLENPVSSSFVAGPST